MKTLIPTVLLLFFGVGIYAQSKQASKDDSKCLSLALLIKIASDDLATVDRYLSNTDYEFSGGDEDSDIASYKFIRNNTFILKKYVSRRRLVYTVDSYTDGIRSRYSLQIGSERLIYKDAVVIKNGIKYLYTDSNGKWLISFSKTTFSPDKTALEIAISPI